MPKSRECATVELAPARTLDTILVVEDEVLIQMCVADYLRDCGYRVLEAGTVREAIEVLEAEPGVDIVFSDVHMPGGQDGFDLSRWTSANRPCVKLILTSGGASAADLATGLCHSGPLIDKPYLLHDVTARIHAALHR